VGGGIHFSHSASNGAGAGLPEDNKSAATPENFLDDPLLV
jgi:hypothetical protein